MDEKKKNCWEVLKCGREPGGKNADEMGTCPSAISAEYDGVNHGTNGGRFCWAIAGTYCTGKVSGTFAKKFLDCIECDFFKQVYKDEEKNGYILHQSELRNKKKK